MLYIRLWDGKNNFNNITPVYNNVSFIGKCIQNEIDQQVNNVIHLIVYVASTYGTIEFITKYNDSYKFIIALLNLKDHTFI